MRTSTLSIIGLLALLLVGSCSFIAVAGPRAALWHVVQACVLNHQLTGASFPCLAVVPNQGGPNRHDGYVVLRSPIDDVKIVVAPTARTVGIEDPRLRGAGAPNYFRSAWEARHFATDSLVPQPPDDDLALAVNSKPGRSQDQLHIHVACIDREVKQALVKAAPTIGADAWTRIQILPRIPRYIARFVPEPDFSKINVVDLAADGLKNDAHDMADTTIVVVGTAANGKRPAGFTILARRRIPHSWDEPHGEGLLDQDCELSRQS